MNIVEKKVQQLMIDYADGGTGYFDALDMYLCGEWQIILQLILTTPVNRPIALQGNFGMAVKNQMYLHNIDRPGTLWIKNSLRQDDAEMNVMQKGLITVNPIFLDDSCYSGKTITGMDEYLTKTYGLNVHYTNVIYDGMRGGRSASINSFFRYYDYY